MKNLGRFLAKSFGLAIAFTVLLLVLSFKINGPTEVSVVTRLGKINRVEGNGVYFTLPIIESITKYDASVQSIECIDGKGKSSCQSLTAATKDLQSVKASVQVSYVIDVNNPNELVRLVKNQSEFNDIIIPSIISEGIKASTSKFGAEDLIAQRNLLKDEVSKALQERMSKFYLKLVDLSIVDLDFSETFNKAIEQKAVAQQELLKKEFELKQAEVEAKKLLVQAQAEAEKQRILKETLDDRVLQKQMIEKWDGKLPQFMLSISALKDLLGVK